MHSAFVVGVSAYFKIYECKFDLIVTCRCRLRPFNGRVYCTCYYSCRSFDYVIAFWRNALAMTTLQKKLRFERVGVMQKDEEGEKEKTANSALQYFAENAHRFTNLRLKVLS